MRREGERTSDSLMLALLQHYLKDNWLLAISAPFYTCMILLEVIVSNYHKKAFYTVKETLINFTWGFCGNSIVVFMAKEIDIAVLLNFFIYYMLISIIVNRAKYETILGKFVVLPGSAALGAFTGYKVAQLISQLI